MCVIVSSFSSLRAQDIIELYQLNPRTNQYEVLKMDKEPQYPGGLQGLMEFLMENVKYPPEAAKAGIQGKVLVSFIVNKDGTISDVSVRNSVNPLLDAEAKRVVSIMPRWIPGEHNGKKVRVVYLLPVTFRL